MVPGTRPRQSIAERTLLLDGEPTVAVRVFCPEWDDEQTASCSYEIAGLQHAGPGRAFGVDTVQALILALHLIAVVLENSAEAKSGRLNWLDDDHFGFRYPDDRVARERP